MARIIIRNLTSSNIALPYPASRTAKPGQELIIDGADVEEYKTSKPLDKLIEGNKITVNIQEDPDIDDTLEAEPLATKLVGGVGALIAVASGSVWATDNFVSKNCTLSYQGLGNWFISDVVGYPDIGDMHDYGNAVIIATPLQGNFTPSQVGGNGPDELQIAGSSFQQFQFVVFVVV